MKKTLLAIAICLLAIPAAHAEKPILGSLWTMPCGQPGSRNAESRANRIANLMAASKYVHVMFETSGPVFDPNRVEVVLQECWTPGEFLQAADDAGAILIVTGALHDNGAHNGNGYHQSVPLLDKVVIRSWWESLIAYVQANHPGFLAVGANVTGIWGASIANEFGYCPNHGCPEDLVHAYLEIFDHVEPVWPGNWIKLDGGIVEKFNVSASAVSSRQLIPSLHCNGETIPDCRGRLEALVAKYGKAMIDEDVQVDKEDGNNDAVNRYRVCSETPGCAGYFTFYARDSGAPPQPYCCWAAHGCAAGSQRWNVGVEGCFHVMNDGTAETVDNYSIFNAAACEAGTCNPTWDFDALPNTLPDTDPPPPGDCSVGTRLDKSECWLDDCRDTGRLASCAKAIRFLLNHDIANEGAPGL